MELADLLCLILDNHEKGKQRKLVILPTQIMNGMMKCMHYAKCEQNGIKPLVERSRSGRGAHVWIFFKRAIPASKARNFGFYCWTKLP